MKTKTKGIKGDFGRWFSTMGEISHWFGDHPATFAVAVAVALAILLVALMGSVNTGIRVDVLGR